MGGGLEDDSLSEGSDFSQQEDDDADGESNDGSEDETTTNLQTDKVNGQVNGRVSQPEQHSECRNDNSPGKQDQNSNVSDTEAMMNGLRLSEDTGQLAEDHFDNMEGERPGYHEDKASSGPPTEPRRDTFAEKKRREHERYVKERDKNPAFVPTRGSFFLHDKRSTEPGSNEKSFNKTKSRPYGLIVDGNIQRYGSYFR